MKCNVFYNVVYNFSIWSEYIAQVSLHSSRIEPFRLAPMFISNSSIVDRIALKRHELKLTVFAFVFCIFQLGFMVL